MLMSNNSEVFKNYKTKIFNTEYTKDNAVDNSSQAQTAISEYMHFVYNGSEITRYYHFNIMKQAQLLLVVFTALFSITTIFILIMIGVIIISKNYNSVTMIPLLAGLATDIFSATLILVMQNLLKSRDVFFRENIKAEHFSKIIGLIQTIEKDSDKKEFIKTIVDNYCNEKMPHD